MDATASPSKVLGRNPTHVPIGEGAAGRDPLR